MTRIVAPGPVASGLRIGLLGGSFNPAHAGHVHVSEVALKRLNLNYVWWLVSPQNPLKPSAGMAPLHERLANALACASHPRIRVTDIETALHTRYTVDTVRALMRRFPHVRFVWLMGSDNLREFGRWRRWAQLAATIPIAIIVRPGSSLAPLQAKLLQRFARARLREPANLAGSSPPALVVIDGPRRSHSATAIRSRPLSTTRKS